MHTHLVNSFPGSAHVTSVSSTGADDTYHVHEFTPGAKYTEPFRPSSNSVKVEEHYHEVRWAQDKNEVTTTSIERPGRPPGWKPDPETEAWRAIVERQIKDK